MNRTPFTAEHPYPSWESPMGSPNPRKLSEASAMMTPPMLMEKIMMITTVP